MLIPGLYWKTHPLHKQLPELPATHYYLWISPAGLDKYRFFGSELSVVRFTGNYR
jgi:hypothetical protein